MGELSPQCQREKSAQLHPLLTASPLPPHDGGGPGQPASECRHHHHVALPDPPRTNGFIQGNEGMQLAGRQQQGRLANRSAIRTPLIGRSALGGGERVDVYTTMLADGNLFYYLSVVPEREEGNYSAVFERVAQSIRLNDR